MSSLPIIAGVEITTDSEGRFNLNALHRASRAEKHKAPNKWLENSSTKELIKELESQTPDSGSGEKSIACNAVNVINGSSNPGTFAHKLLAISYAGWISPAFQLQVNQVFLNHKTGKLSPAPQTQSSAIEAAKWIHQALPNLSERSLQEMISRATRIDFGEALLPLPTVEEPFWTATELALEFGVSANKIGRLTTALDLKTREHGEYRLSKSRHSNKQVQQFYYNEKARAILADLFSNDDKE